MPVWSQQTEVNRELWKEAEGLQAQQADCSRRELTVGQALKERAELPGQRFGHSETMRGREAE